MAKTIVEVEVEHPEHLDVVRYGYPREGEWYIGLDGNVQQATFDHDATMKPIVREKWQWPEWLRASAVAMDGDGTWWAYSHIPRCNEVDNEWIGSQFIVRLDAFLMYWTPPVCEDWRKSLHVNPAFIEGMCDVREDS